MTTAKTFAMFASLLAIVVVPGHAVADPTNGGEAANTPNAAQTVGPGAYSGTLATGADVDWYRVAVPTLSQTRVALSCAGGLMVQLYQGDGQTLIGSAPCGGSVECTAPFNYLAYVKISGAAAAGYSFTVSNGGAPVPPGAFCNV